MRTKLVFIQMLVQKTDSYVKHYPKDSEGDDGVADDVIKYFLDILIVFVAADRELKPDEVELFAKFFENEEWDDSEKVLNVILAKHEQARENVLQVPLFFKVLASHDEANGSNLSHQALEKIRDYIDIIITADGEIQSEEQAEADEIIGCLTAHMRLSGISIN